MIYISVDVELQVDNIEDTSITFSWDSKITNTVRVRLLEAKQACEGIATCTIDGLTPGKNYQAFAEICSGAVCARGSQNKPTGTKPSKPQFYFV